MTTEVEEITRVALALSEHDRAALADTLLGSLGTAVAESPAEVKVAWAGEIKSRVDDIVSGRVKTIPWAEVKAQLAADRAARRG